MCKRGKGRFQDFLTVKKSDELLHLVSKYIVHWFKAPLESQEQGTSLFMSTV